MKCVICGKEAPRKIKRLEKIDVKEAVSMGVTLAKGDNNGMHEYCSFKLNKMIAVMRLKNASAHCK